MHKAQLWRENNGRENSGWTVLWSLPSRSAAQSAQHCDVLAPYYLRIEMKQIQGKGDNQEQRPSLEMRFSGTVENGGSTRARSVEDVTHQVMNDMRDINS